MGAKRSRKGKYFRLLLAMLAEEKNARQWSELKIEEQRITTTAAEKKSVAKQDEQKERKSQKMNFVTRKK